MTHKRVPSRGRKDKKRVVRVRGRRWHPDHDSSVRNDLT